MLGVPGLASGRIMGSSLLLDSDGHPQPGTIEMKIRIQLAGHVKMSKRRHDQKPLNIW